MRIKQSGVYQITNTITGDFYVGSSIDIAVRWNEHRWTFRRTEPRTRSYLFNAVQKYGLEHFTFIVLEQCEPVRGILLEREQFYIDTLLPIYNYLKVAGSRLGAKASPEQIALQTGRKIHSEEYKQHLSVKMTEFMNDPEVKEFYRSLREGKDWTELFGVEKSAEIRAKMSASRKLKPVVCAGWNAGMPMPTDLKEKLFAGRDAWLAAGNRPENLFVIGHIPHNLGIPHTAETREKISAILKGREAWNKGIPLSEDHKRYLSDLMKANFDPEHQKKMTEAARIVNTGKPRSEETVEKIRSSSHSPARMAVYAAQIGREWNDEQRQTASDSQRSSPKVAAHHEGRVGKTKGNSATGQYGIIFDKSRNKHQVRIRGKLYGRFDKLEDAIVLRDIIVAKLGIG